MYEPTTAVDFACGSTLKWLCGAPGTGLGYVSPALMKRGMTPALRGWFSQDNPFNWDIEAFSYAPDTRCFDTGTPSVLPFIASKPGFDWMIAQPAGSVRVHNLSLCHQIILQVKTLAGRPLDGLAQECMDWIVHDLKATAKGMFGI